MLSLIFIVLASLIPFAVTWLTSPEEIFLTTDEPKPKPIFKGNTTKRISKKGKWFILAIILTCFFALIQFIQNENDKKTLNKERDARDSIIATKINKGVDSNRKVLFKDLSEALSKQNLLFDSTQKRLEKLVKDSVQNITYNLKEEDPYFGLSIDGSNSNNIQIVKNLDNTDSIYLFFESIHNLSYNVNLNMAVVCTKNNVLKFSEKQIFNNMKFPMNRIAKSRFNMNTSFSNTEPFIYFFIFGSYTNSAKSKSFLVNEFYEYNNITKTYKMPEPKTYDIIITFLKSKSNNVKQFFSNKKTN